MSQLTYKLTGRPYCLASPLQAEHEAETKFPWGTLLLLLRCWVAVMFLSLLKGGHGAPSVVGAACGAPCSTPCPLTCLLPTTPYFLLPTHYSPLTTHHSPLTTHHSPLTTHYSPLTTHTHYSLQAPPATGVSSRSTYPYSAT
jgi:hypothetical protein